MIDPATGQPTKCFKCGSIYHYAPKCRQGDNPNGKQNDKDKKKKNGRNRRNGKKAFNAEVDVDPKDPAKDSATIQDQ